MGKFNAKARRVSNRSDARQAFYALTEFDNTVREFFKGCPVLTAHLA